MNGKRSKQLRKVAQLIHARYMAQLQGRKVMARVPSVRQIYRNLKRRVRTAT